jgi:hypothetical protein
MHWMRQLSTGDSPLDVYAHANCAKCTELLTNRQGSIFPALFLDS